MFDVSSTNDMLVDPELVVYGLATALTVATLFWLASVWLRHRLRTPNANWRDVVRLAIDSGAPIPASIRSSALRRQLVLSSTRPALLTNMISLFADKSIKLDSEKPGADGKRLIWGFFHPNADAGGGGERVLWAAVKQTLVSSPDNIVVLYVDGNKPGLTQASLLQQATTRFGLQFSLPEASRVVVIALTQARFVDPSTYPILTLLGQSLGMMLLGYEAVSNLVPDVFVDTTGLAFAYPVVSWFTKVPVLSYVHYPFIQSEMLSTLRWLSPKRLYWLAMMLAYRWAGSYATTVTANSTWTAEHLSSVWGNKATVVYPPCATQDFEFDPDAVRTPAVVYVAQFRTEKRHELVIKAFAKIHKTARRALKGQRPHLILIGSVRNDEDAVRVAALQAMATELGLGEDDLTIVQNAPWEAVRKILATSSVGVNAMWNEHFGMGVVEVMAAGLIPVAHASAGPLRDIVTDDHGVPGFLFTSARDPDYKYRADAWPGLSSELLTALTLSPAKQREYRERAHAAAQRFSDAAFAEAWQREIEMLQAKEPEFRRARARMGLYD